MTKKPSFWEEHWNPRHSQTPHIPDSSHHLRSLPVPLQVPSPSPWPHSARPPPASPMAPPLLLPPSALLSSLLTSLSQCPLRLGSSLPGTHYQLQPLFHCVPLSLAKRSLNSWSARVSSPAGLSREACSHQWLLQSAARASRGLGKLQMTALHLRLSGGLSAASWSLETSNPSSMWHAQMLALTPISQRKVGNQKRTAESTIPVSTTSPAFFSPIQRVWPQPPDHWPQHWPEPPFSVLSMLLVSLLPPWLFPLVLLCWLVLFCSSWSWNAPGPCLYNSSLLSLGISSDLIPWNTNQRPQTPITFPAQTALLNDQLWIGSPTRHLHVGGL